MVEQHEDRVKQQAIERRVLAILAANPSGAIIREEDEKLALQTLALFHDHPVTDVYEFPDGGLTGRITQAGIARLRCL